MKAKSYKVSFDGRCPAHVNLLERIINHCCTLPISIYSLAFNHACENSALRDKFIEAAVLNDFAFVNDDNAVDVSDSGKAVSNDYLRGVHFVETSCNDSLSAVIKRGSRLAEKFVEPSLMIVCIPIGIF